MNRLRATVLAAAAAAAVLGQTPASAAAPVAYARAAFVVPVAAGTSYVVGFTVRRGFAGTAGTDLLSQVSECSASSGGCALVSQQIDPLRDADFVVRANGTAGLRTRWAGQPLILDWGRGGSTGHPTSGHASTFVDTNHTETLVEYRALWARAAARSMLGSGGRCLDPLASALTAEHGLAQDVVVRVAHFPRAETIAGLVRTRGRC